MSGTRKRPKLRFDGQYWVAMIYKPDGKRGSISFGSPELRSETEIKIAFERWLELYEKYPRKTLSFDSPYQAIENMINPTTVTTIKELVEKYEANFRKYAPKVRGKQEHPDLRIIQRTARFLQPYSDWRVDSFGVDELHDIREVHKCQIYKTGKKEKHYTRRGINDTLKCAVSIIEWGVGRNIVKHETLIGIRKELKMLKIGDEGAKDNIKREAVKKEELEKVVNISTAVIGDMLKLVWCTGMRPYEVCEMRPYDLLRRDPECWLYIPGRDHTPVGNHKTMRFGKIKVIPLAGECIDILSKRINNFNSREYIFNPQDSVAEYREIRRKNRNTPLSCGNKSGSNKKKNPKRKPGAKYSSDSFNKAFERGCKRAGVEKIVPYDLRRTAATNTRAELGKEAARTLLGHAEESTTNIYLLDEVKEAMKVAKALAKYGNGK